jgi:hypothetical protein
LTAFVTWLKTFTARPGAGLFALGLLLSGCGLLGGSPQAQQPPLPTPPAPVVEPPAVVEAPPLPVAGLTPLPSANALLASVPIGREDPLAPQASLARSSGSGSPTPQGASAATRPAAPAPPPLPADFRFSGVLRAGSTPQAFVQVGGQSGPVCPGPDGTCPASGLPSVLPQGWGVAAIDVERGKLTLRQGSRTQEFRL